MGCGQPNLHLNHWNKCPRYYYFEVKEQGTENLNNFPKITQQVINGVRVFPRNISPTSATFQALMSHAQERLPAKQESQLSTQEGNLHTLR